MFTTPYRKISAIKYIGNRILLQCQIKTGVAMVRSGIISVSDDQIKIGVIAQPRDSEANSEVCRVLSELFKCPMSDVEIVRGHKSRVKRLAIMQIGVKWGDNVEKITTEIRNKLEQAVNK
ncbi:putative DUF167 domain protein [Blumeria hordei DH14]|uniref:Putative DUF167 domain protein n=1 Tax=Blumeria graminis f. sp. hordei (strain DH14) TaxID=546991 RepID=N1JCV9_BLUG1|nr:putative DUF167 domain protein [Blumeria hordei DH14]